ncbi:hypothetical protein WNY37_09730 [Henriciella sp. AS95]|uniref:hypothetical protein n=1 Tax=Henriciella sp. AS95 TaxID=3135782 RepID=UPI0031764FA2
MADIFEEVEEGLRQDRAARLWKRYGVFAYIAAALLIGGVALNEYLQTREAETTETSALEFEAGTDDLAAQNWEAATSTLEPLANEDVDISPLAANYLAEARLSGGADVAGAVEALEKAANTDTPIGKVSLIKAAYLKSATMNRAELETYLGGLADDDSGFGALAIELLAAVSASEGDYAKAREDFNYLAVSHAYATDAIQARARAALAAIPKETAATPDDAAAPEADDTVTPDTDIEPGPGAADGETQE